MSTVQLTDVRGKVDFGIITIREDEFEAVLARFPAAGRVSGRRHYNLCRVDLPGGGAYLGAVLRCIEQGNGEAQSAAHDLLEDLGPHWLFVVGIAGGVPSDEFSLGDVIISTRVHDFSVEAVLQERRPEYALAGGPVDKKAAVLVANLPALRAELGDWNGPTAITASRPEVSLREAVLYGDQEWSDRVRRSLARHAGRTYPRVLSGAIASSDRLIKDTEVLAVWTKMARQVLAAEMESAGVYRATYGRQVPALSIRGISDIVGLKRDPAWTEYACHTAAAFAFALVRTRPFEPRSHSKAAHSPKPTPAGKPQVFIRASAAGGEVAELIQLGLDGYAECTVEAQAAWELGGTSLENLARTARSVDFAVLVLTPGDLVHTGNARNSPRDAVLVEAGFLMGALGRERTCLVHGRDELAELPAGLTGVPVTSYGRRSDGDTRAALAPVCTQLKLAIEKAGKPQSAGPEAPIQTLSSELRSLRTEFLAQAEHMRRMMELLTSEREPYARRGESSRLRAMEGAWNNPLVGSWGYARFLGGELRFVYCYGGSHEPSAEYHGWRFVGDALIARFRWFDRDLEGYVYFDEVSANRLRGGWWFSEEVPESLTEQMVGQVRSEGGMYLLEWVRSEGSAVPSWAKAYFGKIEEVLRPR